MRLENRVTTAIAWQLVVEMYSVIAVDLGLPSCSGIHFGTFYLIPGLDQIIIYSVSMMHNLSIF